MNTSNLPFNPPSQQPEQPSLLIQHLTATGLERYLPILQAHQVDLPTLSSLSNFELRDDLMIAPLAHRRALLQLRTAPPLSATVPLFGSILVHLSNMRTYHSWLSNAVQLFVFAFALLRFAPQLRDSAVTDICAGALVTLAILSTVYATIVYYRVTTAIENSHLYRPDWVGAGLVLFVTIVAASITLSIVVLETIP